MSKTIISSCFPYFSTTFTEEETAVKIQELYEICSNLILENNSQKFKKDKELKLITVILNKSLNFQVQSENFYTLLSCMVKILLRYSNYKLGLQTKISERKRKAKYELAKGNYVKLFNAVALDDQEEIVKTVIDVLHNQNLWPLRRICVEMIADLLQTGVTGSLIFNELCNKIHFIDKPEGVDVKFIVNVLYDLLDLYKWPETEETIIFLERLLNFYHSSLHDGPKESDNALFANLRGSFELCVRHMIKNISNNHRLIAIQHMSSWSIREEVTDSVVLNYGSTLEYAAYMHQGSSLVDTLSCEIFLLLLQMIASSVRFVSLLGNRVLQYLIDTKKNQALFNTPKIFFQNLQLNLKFSQYCKEDEKFLEKNREVIHESFIKSFTNHKSTCLNLETTYCTMCLLAISVPCGFTAAAICCIMMNLQEIVMKSEKTEKESSYHIHAIIISILSFICWIHEAKEFHAYVMRIVMERAQWAPHINPPLQSRYNFAIHHVLWDKPELFLVDWEVRYGLWKRFRLHKFVHKKNTRNNIDG